MQNKETWVVDYKPLKGSQIKRDYVTAASKDEAVVVFNKKVKEAEIFLIRPEWTFERILEVSKQRIINEKESFS